MTTHNRRIRQYLRAQLRRVRVVSMLYRLTVALGYFKAPLRKIGAWLVHSREISNFTYDLEEDNKLCLAFFISEITSVAFTVIHQYVNELETDESLRAHVRRLTLNSSHRPYSDTEARYGRRLGWYAFVRTIKPKVVIETGTDKGLGACVLAAALMKNEQEGYPGRLYTIDINPDSGYLFNEPYSRFGELVIADSIPYLSDFNDRIDLFIHDSNHLPEYESAEFETIRDKISDDSLILSDNAHCGNVLLNFAKTTNRGFLFFREQPSNHWYPGAGIGVAYRKRS